MLSDRVFACFVPSICFVPLVTKVTCQQHHHCLLQSYTSNFKVPGHNFGPFFWPMSLNCETWRGGQSDRHNHAHTQPPRTEQHTDFCDREYALPFRKGDGLPTFSFTSVRRSQAQQRFDDSTSRRCRAAGFGLDLYHWHTTDGPAVRNSNKRDTRFHRLPRHKGVTTTTAVSFSVSVERTPVVDAHRTDHTHRPRNATHHFFSPVLSFPSPRRRPTHFARKTAHCRDRFRRYSVGGLRTCGSSNTSHTSPRAQSSRVFVGKRRVAIRK